MKALVFTLLSISSLLSAAEQPIQLSPVVVENNTEVIPAGGYRVFDQSFFSGRYTNLADFMESVNGIQVNQTGAVGDPVLVSVQGASSNQTKLYINGVLANTGQFGNYDLNAIPLEQIQQVEIYTDQADLELGNAIGGVINIITNASKAKSKLAASVGSYGTYTASVAASVSEQASLELSHEQSANNYKANIPSPAKQSQKRNDRQALNNADYRKTTLAYTQHFNRATLVARFQDEKKDFPDYQRNSDEHDAALSTQLSSFQVKGRTADSKITKLTLQNNWKLAYRYSDESYIDDSNIIGLGVDNNRYYSDKYQLGWSSAIEGEQINSGVYIDYAEENYNSRYLNDPDSRQCLTPSGNCDLYANQKNTTVKFNGGWNNHDYSSRFNAFFSKNRVANLNRRSGDNDNRNETSETYNSYLLNYLYSSLIGDFTFSYKNAIRVPTLYELFGDRGLLLSNDDLQPEQASTYSAAFSNRSDLGDIHITIFQRDLENAIVPVYDSRGVGRYENTSTAELTGLEWQWNKSNDFLTIGLAGSRYDSQTRSDKVKSFNKKNLAGIYHKKLQASLSKHWKSHTFRAIYHFADDLYIDRSNLIKSDKKSTFDLLYYLTIPDGSIVFSVRNAANNQYKDFTNRPARGRWLTLHFNYSF